MCYTDGYKHLQEFFNQKLESILKFITYHKWIKKCR